MKVALFGATGALGREVVNQSLQAGHEVSALVRRVGVLGERDGLAMVVGSLDDDPVQAVLAGADVAVSTLGPQFRMGSRAPVDFMQRQLPPLLQAVSSAGVDRFVLTSAFGVGDTAEKASGLARMIYGLATKPLFADKAAAEAALPSHPVTAVVYPVNLKDARSSGSAAIRPMSAVTRVPGLPTLPFVDAAAAIVKVATRDEFTADRLLITTSSGWRAE